MRADRKVDTLFGREMRLAGFRNAFKREKKLFSLELQVAQAIKEQGWTYEVFAHKIGSARSHVCRDLKGGLQRATVSRIERIARKLHMRYVPLLIPENKVGRILPRIRELVEA